MIASIRYHKVYKNSTLNIMEGADHGFRGKYREPAINAVLDFIDKNENL
ncbi:MAG: hypothetical protein PHX70_03455 [Clostridium sp.]|nr:hypothetical protein [Clostridium sp.]